MDSIRINYVPGKNSRHYLGVIMNKYPQVIRKRLFTKSGKFKRTTSSSLIPVVVFYKPHILEVDYVISWYSREEMNLRFPECVEFNEAKKLLR